MPWYEDSKVDEDTIISSRVRLARNLDSYPFPIKMNKEQSEEIIDIIKEGVLGDRSVVGEQFIFDDLPNSNTTHLQELMEKHLISPELIKKKGPKAVLLMNDESISIMLGEEDHARIQTIAPGGNINDSFLLANQMDDFLSETVTYAFDRKLGYLTSCPTNTGTGLRASFMLHLPALERTGNLKRLLPSITKAGFTVRGLHGEGTKSHGGLYQLSNQVTLGVTEEDIISNLINISEQLIEKEEFVTDQLLLTEKAKMEDNIYRSYGILQYAKQIDAKEALERLSDVRFGYNTGILQEEKPEKTIYQLMMDIQPALIRNIAEDAKSTDNDIIFRAKYLQEQFKNTNNNERKNID